MYMLLRRLIYIIYKYTFQISIWPCVALIVPFKYVGTANGIAALLQYASVGLTSFGIGKILGHIEGCVFTEIV